MSDAEKSTVEYVAYLLATDIAGTLDLKDKSQDYRRDLLDLYAECLETVNGSRG